MGRGGASAGLFRKQVLEIERQRGRWNAYEIAFDEPDTVDVKDSVLLGRQLGVVIRRGKAMFVTWPQSSRSPPPDHRR